MIAKIFAFVTLSKLKKLAIINEATTAELLLDFLACHVQLEAHPLHELILIDALGRWVDVLKLKLVKLKLNELYIFGTWSDTVSKKIAWDNAEPVDPRISHEYLYLDLGDSVDQRLQHITKTYAVVEMDGSSN